MAIYIRCLKYTKLLLKTLSIPIADLNQKHGFSDYHAVRRPRKLTQILQNEKKIYVNIHTTPYFYKRRKTAEERKKPFLVQYPPKPKSDIVDVWKNITVNELAEVLNRDVEYVEDIFLNKIRGGATVIEDLKELQQAIKRSGKRIRIVGKPHHEKEFEDKDVFPRPPANEQDLKPRPPVITVMGHVDHGKTTLLDALRESNVVDHEFGGITQHIGAFSVCLESGAQITFVDTPGHAAFTAMRERGANITDIVVLVVAADDGVMEQTIESIKMARQANVPILVAINKIDAPNADIERTKHMLLETGIQVESMGGDVQAVPISALKRQNLKQLIEAILVQAELLNIKADPLGLVEGVVIDSKIDIYRGKLCTIIVQRGTLKKGNVLVAGTAMAKVRQIKDADGCIMNAVQPGYSAEIDGWKDLPSAGEVVLEVENEKQAKSVLRIRQAKKLTEKQKEDVVAIAAKEEQHLREYRQKLQLKRSLGRLKLKQEGPRKPEINRDDESPTLNIIVKCDVDGTLEAILNTLYTYHSTNCTLDLIHFGVGAITENDIELANTFKAVVYAFNVQCPEQLYNLIKEYEIIVKHHNVIYKLIDDLKQEINSRLPSIEVEEIIGEANVLQQFIISEGKRKIPVAGCICTKGNLKKLSLYKLIRDGNIIHEGPLVSMRHLKNEVDIIKKDVECGLQLAAKEVEFKAGDTLICFEKKLQPQNTDWDPGF